MNILVGERLSIITSKAQTTRHRILGIVNTDDYQIVYSDTPGMLTPKYKMHEGMMGSVNDALFDADVLLLVVDVREPEPIEAHTLAKIKKTTAKVLVILNKIDLADDALLASLEAYWKNELPAAEIIKISALKNKNVDRVLKRTLKALPVHEPFYPKDALTDRNERFFVSEIIREKILLFYKKEIPYSVEVVVESFKEAETIIRIRAEIFVARDSQKAILIGEKGLALKKVGVAARKDMEKFLGKQVHLELFVKVDKDWRDSEQKLKRYGYL